MKLTIEHLAKRLPYGVIVAGDGKTPCLLTVNNYNTFIDNYRKLPVLFPIECLTREITVKGETFTPIGRIKTLSPNTPNWDWIYNGHHDEVFEMNLRESIIEYCVIEYFHRFHIDYEQLIPAGLAVSVFDLPENPYK